MSGPHPVHAWFENEILPWRILSSVIRGLILQVSTLFLFNCVFSFSPTTPMQWMTSNVAVFVTPTSWFFDVVIVACFAGLAMLQAKELRTVTWIPENRLAVLKYLANPSVLLSLMAYVGSGGLLLRCFLGLQGGPHNNLTIRCKQGNFETTCLNEGHVFLVLSGCYLGLCLWIDFHFRNGNLIQFPMIQQSGNAQLKRSIIPLLKTSIVQVLSDLKWFYVAYLISGYRIEHFLSGLFGIELLGEISNRSWSSSVWTQFLLLLAYIKLLSLLGFSIRLMKKVIQINLTKPLRFPNDEGLVEAMSSSGLVGHLACHDFAQLAESSRERRSEFYIISQPGGHPHSWNRLSARCLQTLDDFLGKLNESSQSLRASHQAALAKHQEEEDLRRKFVSGPTRPTDPHSGVQDLTGATSLLSGVQKQKNVLAKVVGALADRLHKNPLLSSSADASLRSVFAQSQTIIFTVEGLSHLIAASVDEDRFGVVQKDLTKILGALLTLQQTVDRQKGLATSSGKKHRCETVDQQLKYELRSTIKSALYRITSKFGPHILDVPLPQEHQKRISNFLNFMEG